MGIQQVASIVMAAGRGSRMRQFEGSKTLLPLLPNGSPLSGTRPILLHILDHLPSGPKSIVVHHDSRAVMDATRAYGPFYSHQPVLNGTGGALLAARPFLEQAGCERTLITMGDVPFVRPDSYAALLSKLDDHHLSVLGFRPADKKEYGVLALTEGRVSRIIESKYWKSFPPDRQADLNVCNAGIYAARTGLLLDYLSILADRPHVVRKQVDGRMTEIEEFFITDLIEYMADDGLAVGYIVAGDEDELMGVDDLSALERAQKLYRASLL